MPSYNGAGRHRDASARRDYYSSESSDDSRDEREEPRSRRRGASSHALSMDALARLNATAAPSTGDRSIPRPQEDRRRERREPQDERREARRQQEERRERRRQRERRDRQQAEEREALRQEHERRERHRRERSMEYRESRQVSRTRRPSREIYQTSRTRSEDRQRRHQDEGRDRRRRSRDARDSGREATDDERRERRKQQEWRESRSRHGQPSYDRYRSDTHDQSQATGHRTKHYYIDHEDDSEDHTRHDRLEADDAAVRRHQDRRDRRKPSGAILEEGLSRGLRKTSAGRAATAAAAGIGVGATAAAAGSRGRGGIFSTWGGHLRGGLGGLGSRGSNDSGSTRDSIERSKEGPLYYAKQRQSPPWSRRKKLALFGGIGGAILIVIIAVIAVVVSKKHNGSTGGSSSNSTTSSSTGLGSISPSSIPSGAPSYLNPYDWVSVTDFNLTYTNETVGGLPIMGLNTSYDDSRAANAKTAPLNKPWGSYTTTPARGVNLGGWLSIEPFITPSLFNYNSRLGIVDEYTMCSYLGPANCASTLENHYATFVTESTFAEIAAAGLDHVRIPFSYWAVEVYDGDPYLFRTSWRYLLRGIEWARKHGLRVNLDLHGLPGSQNGWNHSGRQGLIGWMNGTDGDLNVQRSLDVHDKLSQFFAQPRYKNIISHYGLANEPRMTFLPISTVMNWTQTAASIVRKNGLNNDTLIVFGDGFYGLGKWQGQPNDYNLVLDVHQYEIFNNAQLVYTHAEKIEYACAGWTEQTKQSMDVSTGYGATIVAEWSQADTDCATFLGNVGNGNRWTGTYDVGNASLDAPTPMCPLQNQTCSCANANADASTYSAAYKSFLLTFAEAQMDSFEQGMGWWYWTWDTETATQWSYKQGMAAGILPTDATTRSFSCSSGSVPSFDGLPEYY
ncbi:hypothetical protein SEPCBS119000_000179 [Sporothrix epigloea]|uniref:glucan 1,3-beta-glucosidase n=1 Tax=Sporothrix epigloea TaxID=1892477 RepID=A0ABP0D3M7_9PEZI